MGSYVPKTLLQFDNWVVWRRVGNKKPPFSAKFDGGASVTRPGDWADYATAKAKATYGDFDGVGFVFDGKSGLVFIDLDHCIDDEGEPNEFASGIIDMFAGSYMEYSQSGTGLHIICKGSIPAAYKSAQIELYNVRRYAALTFDVYEASEPQDAQRQLDILCRRFNIEAQSAGQIEQQPMTASDREIIARAERGRNGEQFKRLYAGQWQDSYKTQSSADMRLIALLWYYSRNVEQVERLFLASGLGQREKAQREDYVRRTIEVAAKNTPTEKGRTERQQQGKYKRPYWK